MVCGTGRRHLGRVAADAVLCAYASVGMMDSFRASLVYASCWVELACQGRLVEISFPAASSKQTKRKPPSSMPLERHLRYQSNHLQYPLNSMNPLHNSASMLFLGSRFIMSTRSEVRCTADA